jgi:DNA polymerase V
MSCYALIDCNNFFASCERVFRPDLISKPVAILSNNDGCIISRSNEVKSLGIPMGVPLFKVKEVVKSHDIQLFSANFELYGDMSQRIVRILREETPLIEVYSIDECFIDLSEMPIVDVRTWAVRVRDRILWEVGIPTSIGVAPTKTLAKVASTFAKTHGDGVWSVMDDRERIAMLAELPVASIWGIGRRLGPKLLDKGVSKAIQLVEASDTWLAKQFNITGIKMVDELRGIPRIPFGDQKEQRGSIMRSRSFGHRVRRYHELESAIASFTAQAASRLRSQDSVCRGIVVFLATGGMRDLPAAHSSHLITLSEATAHTGELITAALKGLSVTHDEFTAYKKAGVILVGISDVKTWQLSMLASHESREKGVTLMNVSDELNHRFGKGTLWHASESRQALTWLSKRELSSPHYTTSFSDLPKLYR